MSIKIADAFIEVLLDYAKAEKQSGEMEKTIGGLTKGAITKLSTAMVGAGAAITGTLGVATAKAASFGELLANVATLGVKDLGALDSGVKDLSMKFGIDLNDAATTLYDTLSAGIPENAAIMVMEQAARGAEAGIGSMSEAMDLGTSAMNAWNLKSADANVTTANFEKIMGQAATAVKAGKTTIAEMAQSIGAVAPIMSTAGVSTEEFFAAVAALTATGMPASQAMTSMRAAISNVIKPGESAAETAEALGLQFDAAALQSKGLAGFLAEVAEKTGGNVETMGKLFGSVEGLGSVISLTGNQADNFKNILTDMGNAQSNLNDMSKAYQENNPAYEFAKARAALNVVIVEIGNGLIPALTKIMQLATPILEWIAKLLQASPPLTATIVTITGVIGALSLGLGSMGFVLAGLFPLLTATTGGLAGTGAAAAAAGTAATGAAGGFAAMAASAGIFVVTAGAVVAILAASGFAIYKFATLAYDTVNAFKALEESTKRTNAAFEEYEDTLVRQGVALDKAALKEMQHAERSAAITQAVISHKENAMAREIFALTGVDATRDQIHRAELARVGLMISREEAAALAVRGITEEEIRARMQAAAATEQAEAAKQRATAATADMQAQSLAETINTMAQHQGMEKVSTGEVSEYKRLLLSGDLDAAEAYWVQLRQQTARGLELSFEQWRDYSANVQAEMAVMRQNIAYAMNPAQTGSPSLNQEMASGFDQTREIIRANAQYVIDTMSFVRQAAQATLTGLGSSIIGTSGPTPGPSDVAPTTGGGITGSGMGGGGDVSAPVSVSAPVNVTINGNISRDQAKEIGREFSKAQIEEIARKLGRRVEERARGFGIRKPGLVRNPVS